MEEKILEYLFMGMTQVEISEELKKNNITPNSLSSIEKKLKQIKEIYRANTMFHLAVILSKDTTLVK